METAVQVKRLVKRYGIKPALRGVDFSAAEGEFIAILGPNGAGKTTFLRILASLNRPSGGEVWVAGCRLPHQAAEARLRLGVLGHQPMLYGDLTAAENLRFFARLYDLQNAAARVEEILGLVGLTRQRNDLVRTFSRGMQQRLAIGRAVLHDPQVLLLDEPHTGLDQDACEMLDGLLRQVASRQRTILLTTHDLARAAGLAGRFDVLSRGKILASARAAELPADGLLAFYRQTLEAAA